MADVSRDLLGTVIEGRYRLVARLGDGAVGSVYRAEDLGGGAARAIKVWRRSVLDSQAAGRFHRETKALATLEHPHIVAIYDYGLIEGLPYMAMQLLHGESLAERQERQGVFGPQQASEIGTQILKALSYAHARNVVHRDLKPDNVFLSNGPGIAPHVTLLDFGLAKFLLSEDDPVAGSVLTRKGTMVGTPLYVAPEQALGGAIDARADVYSVGCVLFEMLSGEPPFLAENVTELLRAHLSAPIPRLGARVADLPACEAWQALIDRALAKNAPDRFANAAEMLSALPNANGAVASAAESERRPPPIAAHQRQPVRATGAAPTPPPAAARPVAARPVALAAARSARTAAGSQPSASYKAWIWAGLALLVGAVVAGWLL